MLALILAICQIIFAIGLELISLDLYINHDLEIFNIMAILILSFTSIIAISFGIDDLLDYIIKKVKEK